MAIYYWHDPNNPNLIRNGYVIVLGAAFLQKDLVFPGAVLCTAVCPWELNVSVLISHRCGEA